MIRSGDLDRTIIIERATETISDSGAVTPTFAPFATLRAKLITITTTEMLRNGGGFNDAVLVFKTHWFDGILTSDQIAYAGTSYAIKSISEIGRRRGLEFTVEALV